MSELSSLLVRDQITTLFKLLNSHTSIQALYIACLKNLQSTLWLPCSSLALTYWSPFSTLKCVRNDFLAQTLIAAHSPYIQFSSSLSLTDLKLTGGHIPILDLIPSSYVLHITSLKFKNLLFLLQNLVCHPNSFKLLPRYNVPEHLSVNLPLLLIPLNKKCKSVWAAHWAHFSESIIYG